MITRRHGLHSNIRISAGSLISYIVRISPAPPPCTRPWAHHTSNRGPVYAAGDAVRHSFAYVDPERHRGWLCEPKGSPAACPGTDIRVGGTPSPDTHAAQFGQATRTPRIFRFGFLCGDDASNFVTSELLQWFGLNAPTLLVVLLRSPKKSGSRLQGPPS